MPSATLARKEGWRWMVRLARTSKKEGERGTGEEEVDGREGGGAGGGGGGGDGGG